MRRHMEVAVRVPALAGRPVEVRRMVGLVEVHRSVMVAAVMPTTMMVPAVMMSAAMVPTTVMVSAAMMAAGVGDSAGKRQSAKGEQGQSNTSHGISFGS